MRGKAAVRARRGHVHPKIARGVRVPAREAPAQQIPCMATADFRSSLLLRVPAELFRRIPAQIEITM